MVFTEHDAENDGKIKREVGSELAKVMKTQNPEVFDHFVNVCEEVGRPPADVFGEMVVRCLNSEEYADRVLSSELSMKQLRADEIRLEDVQYVKRLTEELGLNETHETSDPIDQLIDQRLQSITRSPIPRLNQNNQSQNGSSEEMARFMQQMEHKMENLESKLDENAGGDGGDGNGGESGGKSIDDLFSDNGEGDSSSEREEVQTGDVVGMGDGDEPPQEDDEGDGPDDGPSEQELDEALSGVIEDDGDDGEEDGPVEGPFTSTEADDEIEYRDNEIEDEDEEE